MIDRTALGRRMTLALALVAGLAAAGCGGDDEPARPAATEPAPARFSGR